MESTSFFDRILRTLSFPFKEKDWGKKVLIGCVVTLAMFIVPIIPAILVAGYAKRIMQRIIIEDSEPYLPEWDDWGKMLSDGAKLWGASFLYSLPLVLLALILMFTMLAIMFSPILFLNNQGMNDAGIWIILVSMLLFAISIFAIFPLSIATSLLQAPALAHLVAKDNFSAAFNLQEWWPILKKGIGAFLMAMLAIMAISLIANIVFQFIGLTIILMVFLPLLLMPYSFLLAVYNYTFHAMAYREGVRKLAETAQ